MINQVTIISSTAATIRLDPGERDIPASGGGMRWKFSGNSYSFTSSDGVSFANYPTNPNTGPGRLGIDKDGKEFVVCFGDNSSTANGKWNYAIKFYDTSRPGTVWLCDPTIVSSGLNLVHPTADLTVACVIAPP